MSVLPLSYTPGPKQILKRKHTDNVDTIWLALGDKQEWMHTQRKDCGWTGHPGDSRKAEPQRTRSHSFYTEKGSPEIPNTFFLWVKTEITRPLLVFSNNKISSEKSHAHCLQITVHDSWLLLVKMASDTVVTETRWITEDILFTSSQRKSAKFSSQKVKTKA